MIEKIRYVNHLGQTIEFGIRNLFSNQNDLRDYKWGYKTLGTKVALSRNPEEKSIPAIVFGSTEEESIKIKNELFEIAEKDIIHNIPGTLFVNDYFIKCYIIGSKKNNYLRTTRYLENELTIMAPYPFWCHEKEYHFYMSPQSVIDENVKEESDNIIGNSVLDPDYKHDYPRKYQTRYRPAKKRYLRDYKYDYYHNHQLARLDNDHFVESGFKMTIYGPCTEPKIWISDHLYHVAVTLYDSEYLVIDSRERTVVRYARNGVQENCFGKRDNKNYVFQKIPPGKNAVKWNATYSFDLTLYQERSEPPWR